MEHAPTEGSIYGELGVPAVINAAGTKTRIGGSRIREEAVDAMARAAETFVRISDLQAKASERIAEETGAEAGYVTAGAAAGFELSAAACIAGHDLGTMARLPDTTGVPAEVVIPRTHRTGYDHAIRAAGATIVDVGTNDRHLGTGAADVEPWEFADAIGEETAAIAVVQKAYGEPRLGVVVDVAHEHDVPVIVDAAAELPPVENLTRFVETSADLVVFSGGKAVRGPQSTGFVAGRSDLVASIAMQQLDMHAAADVYEPPSALFDVDSVGGVPRQGIGRSLKAGKEEIVGFLSAFELFVAEDHDSISAEWRERATAIARRLDDIDGLDVGLASDGKSTAPEAIVRVDPEAAGQTAVDLVESLRQETPKVYVAADDVRHGSFSVNPMCLTDEEANYVVERIQTHLRD